MRLLLDAHVLLWLAFNPRRIPYEVRALINDPANRLSVSIASVWELAIKARKGKLAEVPPGEFSRFIERHRETLEVEILLVTESHVLATLGLPEIHGDPFDRILVAQAQVEGLTIVTNDATLRSYPVDTTW